MQKAAHTVTFGSLLCVIISGRRTKIASMLSCTKGYYKMNCRQNVIVNHDNDQCQGKSTTAVS